MLHRYNPSDGQKMTFFLSDGRTLSGEFFDGMRIDPDTIPAGKHWYQTRHDDYGNWSDPVTIIEEHGIAVNFCGTLISDTSLGIESETEIDDFDYES